MLTKVSLTGPIYEYYITHYNSLFFIEYIIPRLIHLKFSHLFFWYFFIGLKAVTIKNPNLLVQKKLKSYLSVRQILLYMYICKYI